MNKTTEQTTRKTTMPKLQQQTKKPASYSRSKLYKQTQQQQQ